jgi:hypothetical protein
MSALLLWIATLAGVAGVLLSMVAVGDRIGGAFWLGGFQSGTLLLAGMAAMLLACLSYIALHVEQRQGRT